MQPAASASASPPGCNESATADVHARALRALVEEHRAALVHAPAALQARVEEQRVKERPRGARQRPREDLGCRRCRT